MEEQTKKPMELIKCGLLKLSDLPQSWADPKWLMISYKYGLDDIEMVELQARVALQNSYRKARAMETITDGDVIARVLFVRTGYSVAMLPTDVTDKRWIDIQRTSNLKDAQITVLMHYIAVQSDIERKEKKEQQIRDGCAMGRWVDPVERGDRSAPYSALRRRRFRPKVSCIKHSSHNEYTRLSVAL